MVDSVKSRIERKLQRDQSDRSTPRFPQEIPKPVRKVERGRPKGRQPRRTPPQGCGFWRILTGSEHGHRNVPASEDLVIDGGKPFTL